MSSSPSLPADEGIRLTYNKDKTTPAVDRIWTMHHTQEPPARSPDNDSAPPQNDDSADLGAAGASCMTDSEPPSAAINNFIIQQLSSTTASNEASCSSSSHMGTTGDATDSASSSYPASPATRFLDAALESSPPTTPSQTSSSEELSKTFVKPSALPRNLLQERIAMNLRLQTASSPRHSHTRSSSYSGWSSAATSEASPITPASGRSPSRSSVQSTASSIFDRMCGGSKSLASLAELYTEHKPSMGVFTPVSAKTASGSLRHLTVGRRGILSTLTFQYPLSSEEEEEGEDGAVSSLPRHRYQRLAARHHHGSLAPPPTVCLTSSSFQSPSPLDSEYPHPAESSASSQSQSQSPRSSTTATPKTPTSSRHPSIPAPWLNNSIIKSPSSSSSSPPNRRLTTPTTLSRGTHKKSGSVPISAMPALDPTLAALEKGCRLRSKVECVACGAVGWDFPKDRNGRAICSRECRMALKAQSAATGSTGEQITAPVLRVV